MATKTGSEKSTPQETPANPFSQLQEAGLGGMVGVSTAWIEAMGDMGAEVMGFVADRIKEDVKTQHRILHCKDVSELQQIQADFVQKAVEQYQEETGKLVEMSAQVFTNKSS